MNPLLEEINNDDDKDNNGNRCGLYRQARGTDRDREGERGIKKGTRDEREKRGGGAHAGQEMTTEEWLAGGDWLRNGGSSIAFCPIPYALLPSHYG